MIKARQVGLEAIERRVEDGMRKGRDMTPLMQNIAGMMAASAEANFAAQGRPAWKDLAPSTKKSRERKGKWPGMILQVSSQLASSIHEFFSPLVAGIGTNKIYAAIQQLGGTIKQYARSQKLYFHQDKVTGEVGSRFVRKKHSNFSQWATMGDREIKIEGRPYLQLTPGEIFKIEEAALRFMVGT